MVLRAIDGVMMRLIYFSLFVVALLFIVLGLIGQMKFAFMGAISVAPVNLLHGARNLKDFMGDSNKYKGAKVFYYPPLIFFFLVLTHHWWLN